MIIVNPHGRPIPAIALVFSEYLNDIRMPVVVRIPQRGIPPTPIIHRQLDINISVFIDGQVSSPPLQAIQDYYRFKPFGKVKPSIVGIPGRQHRAPLTLGEPNQGKKEKPVPCERFDQDRKSRRRLTNNSWST